MGVLDLEEQLIFYRSYHHDRINVLIHLVFVPILTATSLMMLINVVQLVDLPYIPINGAAIVATTYLILYFLMEPVAAATLMPVLLGLLVGINTLTKTYGSQATWIAFGVWVFSWIIQFIGHGFFEKRSPALKDNLAQALFLAPLFVWFELLFSLGYRPELLARIDEDAVRNIAKFRAEQAQRKAVKNSKAQ